MKFLLVTCLLLLVPQTARVEEEAVSAEKILVERGAFFIGAEPQLGVLVNDFRRATGGLNLRGGYGITDDWSVFLDSGWRFTRQFNVLFHFIDLAPHVSYLAAPGFYLLAGGGPTFADASSGTRITGFSTTQGVQRWGYLVGAGAGYIFVEKAGLSLSGEVEGFYRKIKAGNFFEPVLRLSLAYQF